ncbi:MAG: hypothetical protein ACI39U_02050, partial [Candidatus Cryptobacteroides sp.]
MKPYLALLMALLSISCSLELDDRIAPRDGEQTREVQINLLVDNCNAVTKSALFTDSGIRDLNLYVWREGRLSVHSYYESVDEAIRIPLVLGDKYSVYAVANMGKSIEPDTAGWEKDETSMQGLKVDFPDDDSVRGFCPFAGLAQEWKVGDVGAINLKMERIVSRIRIRFCPDTALSGSEIRITGIRIKDAPDTMRPFCG